MPKSKIIKELVKDEISLEKALYRVIVLAKDLKDSKLEQWAKNEINGYDNPEEIPEYRRVKPFFMGSYVMNGVRYDNSPLPMEFLKEMTPKEQEEFLNYKMKETILMIEIGKKENKNQMGLSFDPTSIQLFSYGTNIVILSARMEINRKSLIEIFSKVKQKILDILCELEDKFGCLDDMDIADSDDKIKNEAKQNIYNIIMCDTFNDVEIGDNNTIKDSSFLSKINNKKWI